MILIDKALEERESSGSYIRVAMVGAGYMARGIALQIINFVSGMKLVGISNRRLSEAIRAYSDAGIEDFRVAETEIDVDEAITQGKPIVCEDAMLLCKAECVDAIIEVTGTIDFGAQVSLKAIEHGKHVILMNAELDATLGPILKIYADKAGVVFTDSDGDQPGVIMNLYRWVSSIGCKPILAGNMKGLQDPYRTPETQKGFAEQYYQKPSMVTSFADGTKISMEMAAVANATGMKVGQRGMYGPSCDDVREAKDLFPLDKLMNGGIVDYILCSSPPGGVFVLGYNENPLQQRYMNYYKMGDGPIYVFYTPYHLCHLETPLTVARAVLFNDAAVTPLGQPCVDVVAAAKKDLSRGQILDGLGHFMTYGVAENSDIVLSENLLPIGLAEGCCLKRDIKKDEVLRYSDVELPPNRFCDKLRIEQNNYFNLVRA